MILIFSLMQLYQKIFQTFFVCLGCTSIKVLKTFYVKSLEMSSNSIQKPIIYKTHSASARCQAWYLRRFGRQPMSSQNSWHPSIRSVINLSERESAISTFLGERNFQLSRQPAEHKFWFPLPELHTDLWTVYL